MTTYRRDTGAGRIVAGIVVAGFGLPAVLGGGALIAHAYSTRARG